MVATSFPPARPAIRGPGLRRALIAGCRRVIGQRELLNRINVFPVADGDTGSNLAFTLGSVLAGAQAASSIRLMPRLRQRSAIALVSAIAMPP